ncbi:MAG: hypothetical protein D6786_06040 [Gammaproteobacteria bacterium]|nr:MAG: hypothetical protein D6786_06040 [Gammaproteobacteria bacterium]
MATFRELLLGSPEELVRIFYRIPPTPDAGFIERIDIIAGWIGLSHCELVCGLGFNPVSRDLTDILAVIGFSSHRLLCARRDELFTHDAYGQLTIEDVIEIYAAADRDEAILQALRELVPRRLEQIERGIGRSPDPTYEVSYKMEVHALYESAVATPELAEARLQAPIGHYRLISGEALAIAREGILPASNLVFMDGVLAEEKVLLFDHGLVEEAHLRNRLLNPRIPEEERSALQARLGEE